VEKSCTEFLEPIPRIKGELVHLFCIFGFWSVLLRKTGWTGFGNRCDRFWLLSMHKSRGSLFWLRGVAYVQGELLYALVVCALCLSMVLSRMCRVVALA
jgi:hypothetical protein